MKNFENTGIRKRMVALGIGTRELAKEMGYSYGSVSHWLISPLTETHKKLVTDALDRIEAERNN